MNRCWHCDLTRDDRDLCILCGRCGDCHGPPLKCPGNTSLETRLACLERVLGTLLTFLGNTGILANEDVAPLVCELEAHRTREEPADGARSHPVPSPPDKPP